MKLLTLPVSLAICLSSIFLCANGQKNSPTVASAPRIEKTVNSHWTFNYFPSESADRGYESVSTDDSRWIAISIPHTWSTYETTKELHPFIRNAAESDNPYWWNGWGWYRKHFSVNSAFSGRKVFLEFEGVQKYCKVWINGKYLGDHKGGYSSFDFDITQFIKQGGDNVIAVAVSNNRKDQFRIPPMTAGNFNVYGGIYRDVTIVLKNKLHIPMQGSASHEGGTFITTPSLNEKSGTVRVQTWVKNDNAQVKSCALQTTILDAAGKPVQVIRNEATIKPGELYRFDQTSKPVKNPHLWSPGDPYMYKVRSEVLDGKQITDTYLSPLGFRWFRWNYVDNSLYVNGKKLLIHGGNRHQEYPWLGDAIPKWITEMDYTDMAVNMNYNFMRTVHYPNDRFVYDLADRLGIAIDEEVPNIKNLDFDEKVQVQQLREMIRRDRNHPSIMFWSMGNETNKAVDSKFAIEEDTTRILTARRVDNGSQGVYAKHSDNNLALENLLRCTIRGWYNSDVKDLAPDDQQHSGTEEHQMNTLIASSRFGKENLCTWLYEDHGADREYLNSPMLHVNPKGYVDVYRVPKYAYYLWQASYAEKPMAFILPHFWRKQYLGQKKDITVTSNCEKVELKVNGVSKGTLTPDLSNFHTVVFRDIQIEQGTITATGTLKGATVVAKVVMAEEPARIVLTTGQKKIAADRASVAIIMADIVDRNGNHVYGANNTLKWNISGPATLVGAAVYESDIEKHHAMEGVWYMDAPVANIIRSTGDQGKIRVSVSSSGLASGFVEIECEPAKTDNSAVSEPPLKNDGRGQVARLVLEQKRIEDTPQEIKKTFDDLKFSFNDRTSYRKAVSDYLLKNNPATDTSTCEFRALADLFAAQLLYNNGSLIADDYNFNADHFNNCRLIAGYIAATKLPQLFKEGLRIYYSDLIIRKGSERNAGDEMNWLNWIPSGGTVVYYSDKKKPVTGGSVLTEKYNLSDLITIIHPAFANFSEDGKTRALEFIAKMNPYVHAETISSVDKNGKKISTTVLKAEKEKPVLIPLYKFIAE